MPAVKLNFIFEEYKNSINKSLLLVTNLNNYRELRGGKLRPILLKNINLISELVFLKIFISWETFLEQTFIRYMCGGVTSSGYYPDRYVKPKKIDHAMNILLQNKEYLDWTRWNEVKTWAKNFFKNGEPYEPAILGSEVKLNEMKTIRNRIAHHSEASTRKFHTLVRNKLGNVPRGITPGKLLIINLPGTGDTILQDYVRLLLSLGQIIVP